MEFLELRQRAREHFQAQVLLIAQVIGPALEYADFVVQPLPEAEGHPLPGVHGYRDLLPGHEVAAGL